MAFIHHDIATRFGKGADDLWSKYKKVLKVDEKKNKEWKRANTGSSVRRLLYTRKTQLAIFV
jgi:hypothetical protein